MQGEYHRVHAPGLHHDNCPGVTHSDELYFMWNPFVIHLLKFMFNFIKAMCQSLKKKVIFRF